MFLVNISVVTVYTIRYSSCSRLPGAKHHYHKGPISTRLPAGTVCLPSARSPGPYGPSGMTGQHLAEGQPIPRSGEIETTRGNRQEWEAGPHALTIKEIGADCRKVRRRRHAGRKWPRKFPCLFSLLPSQSQRRWQNVI